MPGGNKQVRDLGGNIVSVVDSEAPDHTHPVSDITGSVSGFTVPFPTPEVDDVVRVEMPFAGTLTAWRLAGDDDIKIDVWKDSYANLPVTDADSITNSNEPELVSVTKAESTDLSGWSDVDFAEGDWLVFHVDTVGGAGTYADLALRYTRA